MALVQWNDTLSVRIGLLDEQHKGLVQLINALHDAMKSGKGKTVIEEVLQSLVTYTRSHFTTEEHLMEKHAYPGLRMHAVEHGKLTDTVLKFQRDYHTGKQVLTLDVLQFLKEWLVQHIQGTDMQYSAYLKSKGVQ